MGRGRGIQTAIRTPGSRGGDALGDRELRAELARLNEGFSISEHELDFIDGYVGDEVHELVNGFLRFGPPALAAEDSPETMRRLVDLYIGALDGVMSRAPCLERPISVFRALTLSQDLSPGQLVPEGAFVSTSIARERAEAAFTTPQSDVLRLRVPAGVRVLSIGDLEGLYRYRHEEEVLLPRGGAYRIHAPTSDGLLEAAYVPGSTPRV